GSRSEGSHRGGRPGREDRRGGGGGPGRGDRGREPRNPRFVVEGEGQRPEPGAAPRALQRADRRHAQGAMTTGRRTGASAPLVKEREDGHHPPVNVALLW